jgi:hypothetical protein
MWERAGIIEGFYGRPWSWDERVDVLTYCADRGMRDYVYAPKDDPLHRERWRELYDREHLAGFERLVAESGLRVGFAISPGLSIDYHADDDRQALAAKVDQVVDLGIDYICLALDDIPVRPGLGEDHAGITTWLREHLGDRAEVLLVPTEYTGTRSTTYLDALASGVPGDVGIAWTGLTVICDEITVEQTQARANSLGDRPPVIWDNYPVNDALMGDRLFMGPLRGREPGLDKVCAGYLANPMVQPMSSKLPLASIAAYLRGEDPIGVWGREADDLGLRTFAEACDGEHPRALVGALVEAEANGDRATWADALSDLRTWCKDAEVAETPGLGDEASRWQAQIGVEAGAALMAVRTLEAIRAVGPRSGQEPDLSGGTEKAMATAALWQLLARGEVSVMGPRRGFRAVISQADDGGWRFHRASIQQGLNAVDLLVEHTLDVLDAESH